MPEIIHPQDFDETYKAIYESIYSKNNDSDSPFGDLGWKLVVIKYGLNMGLDTFNALSTAADYLRDEFLIIKDTEILSPLEPAYKIPWDYDQLNQVRTGTILGHVSTDLFGKSGKWGMRCTVHDFSWLGGHSSFINKFLEALGGEDEVRHDFLQFANDEWQVTPSGKQEILATVGWSE